jgi:DNA-binding transcriptional MerR regulator
MDHDLMKTAEVSALTRVPPETLRYFRWRGEGPPSFKIGRTVVYERADVLAWIEAQKTATGRGGATVAPRTA